MTQQNKYLSLQASRALVEMGIEIALEPGGMYYIDDEATNVYGRAFLLDEGEDLPYYRHVVAINLHDLILLLPQISEKMGWKKRMGKWGVNLDIMAMTEENSMPKWRFVADVILEMVIAGYSMDKEISSYLIAVLEDKPNKS